MKLLDIQKLLNTLNNRKKSKLCVLVICIVAIETVFLSSSFTKDQSTNTKTIVETRFKQLIASIDSLEKSVANSESITRTQNYFFASRKKYKHLEALIEYISPFFAKYYINGPAVKKHDIETGNKVFEPHGFQLLESCFFSNDTNTSKEEVIYEIKLLKETLLQIEKKHKSVVPRTEQYFDLVQQELIRVISLNINGYDCVITKENINECSFVLDGIYELIGSLNEIKTKSKSFSIFKNQVTAAQNYLSKNRDYNSFNRIYFIITYIKPLYSTMYTIRGELNLPNTPINYAVNFDEKNMFGKRFFNKNFFSVNISDSLNTTAQVELGRNLFFDPVLSGNNKRACSSCHKPELAFADSVAKNLSYDKSGFLNRNTPSLLNVMYQRSFFYDGRSLQLEDQVSEVLHAKQEMHSDPNDIIAKLKTSEAYKKLFRTAFKGKPDTAITFYGVLKSISEFEKTLISMNSKFDNYLNGNKTTLNTREINGYNVFSGKALCGSCHFLPLFNGLVPPIFNDNEFEVIGTPQDPDSKIIDSDSGRFMITKKNIHVFAFKTPSIRNIENSFPYMHNGSFKKIDQIIEFYNKGGGKVLLQKVQNQTLPFDSLNLTVKEKEDIKLFLMCLSDNPYKNIRPKKLPDFNNPVLNKRKLGGEY